MKVYGQLERAQLENVGALPAAGIKGRKVILTTDNREYVDNGTSWEILVSATSTDTLTNKTLTGNVAVNLVSGAATVTLPTTTSTLSTLALAETLTNKTLTAPVLTTPVIDVASMTDQGSTPATPSAGTTKLYAKTDGKLYKITSLGTEVEVGSGAGGGSINYITNPDAESATTGWTTYKEASVGSLPVLATGAAADAGFTFTRTTSSPLRGTASFLVSTTAANLQGNAASFAFTVPAADAAKVISISFDYNIASGTYVTGDLIAYIYDVTNSQLIQPAGFQIPAMGSTLANKFQATFQTSATGTSYKLIFHRAVSTSSAMTMKIDNVVVGPEARVYGAPITDWKDHTPTFTGLGTPTITKFQTRQVGGNLEFYGRIVAGTVTGSDVSFGLPAGLSLAYNTASYIVGSGTGQLTDTQFNVMATSASTTLLYLGDAVGSGVGFVNLTGTNVGTGNTITFQGSVAILGWSSSVELSSSTDTRVIAATYSTGAGQSITTGGSDQIIDFGTKVQDTAGLVTTGGSWKFTAQVPGTYEVNAFVEFTNGGGWGVSEEAYLALYKNGGSVTRLGGYVAQVAHSTYVPIVCAPRQIELNAGDYIDLRVFQSSGGTLALLATGVANWVSIKRLSGPSVIAASESVNCRYYQVSAQTAITSAIQINFDTKDYDSHNSVTTGAGAWKFTAPIAGKYRVSYTVVSGSTLWAANDSFVGNIYKNGAQYTGTPYMVQTAQAAVTTRLCISESQTVNLLAGDYIDLRVSSAKSTVPYNNSGVYISIERVGN